MLRDKFEFAHRKKYETRKIKAFEYAVLFCSYTLILFYLIFADINITFGMGRELFFDPSSHFWIFMMILIVIFITVEVGITRYIVIKNVMSSKESKCLWKETLYVNITYALAIGLIGMLYSKIP